MIKQETLRKINCITEKLFGEIFRKDRTFTDAYIAEKWIDFRSDTLGFLLNLDETLFYYFIEFGECRVGSATTFINTRLAHIARKRPYLDGQLIQCKSSVNTPRYCREIKRVLANINEEENFLTALLSRSW